MILYRKFSPEEVLEALAFLLGQNLKSEIKISDAQFDLSFNDDHSVEVYLSNTPIEDSSSSIVN